MGETVIRKLESFKIGLALRASGHCRIWPLEYYQRLAEILKDTLPEVKCYLLDNGVECGWEASNVVNLCGKLSLRQVAAVVSELDLLIGSDSGLVHVAAALDKPFIAIYSTIPPELRLKYYKNYFVFWANYMVNCCPCFDRGCGDKKCLTLIKPEIVAEKVIEFKKKGFTFETVEGVKEVAQVG